MGILDGVLGGLKDKVLDGFVDMLDKDSARDLANSVRNLSDEELIVIAKRNNPYKRRIALEELASNRHIYEDDFDKYNEYGYPIAVSSLHPASQYAAPPGPSNQSVSTANDFSTIGKEELIALAKNAAGEKRMLALARLQKEWKIDSDMLTRYDSSGKLQISKEESDRNYKRLNDSLTNNI